MIRRIRPDKTNGNGQKKVGKNGNGHKKVDLSIGMKTSTQVVPANGDKVPANLNEYAFEDMIKRAQMLQEFNVSSMVREAGESGDLLFDIDPYDDKVFSPVILNEIKHPKKRAFLRVYARLGNITESCRRTGVSAPTYFFWMREDVTFAEASSLAKEAANDYLEKVALHRAVVGTRKPIYHNGVLVGFERQKSDTLLIFLMKGNNPQKYRERFEVSGDPNAPIAIKVLYGDTSLNKVGTE